MFVKNERVRARGRKFCVYVKELKEVCIYVILRRERERAETQVERRERIQ